MTLSKINHLQFNVDQANLHYYKELLSFLGWSIWCDEPQLLGMGDAQGESLWFSSPAKTHQNDHDGPGMNHLGLGVDTQTEVDEIVTYLQGHGVPALFETPRHRPEFCSSPEKTYYQVMFESPDGILFEVVYMGPKNPVP